MRLECFDSGQGDTPGIDRVMGGIMQGELGYIALIFKNEKPMCPCGSTKFDATLSVLSSDCWQLERMFCSLCYAPIDLTTEVVSYIQRREWSLAGTKQLVKIII